jgi:SAM-dependent methyltransferase
MRPVNENDSGIARRPIGKDGDRGNFDVQYLAHLSRYDFICTLLIDESKRLGRPVHVLSVGCGEMWELRTLVSTYWVKKSDVIASYMGIDIEEQDVPVGAKLEKDINFQFIQQDLTVDTILPIDDASIDVIVNVEFIEHIDRKYGEQMMEELRRVIAPGGIMYLSTPNGDNNVFEEKYHRHEYGYDEMLELLYEMGFDVIDTHGIIISKKKFSKLDVYDRDMEMLVNRFGVNWLKIILATEHPELSDCVGYLCEA